MRLDGYDVARAEQYASECGDCAGTRITPADEPCTECADVWAEIKRAEAELAGAGRDPNYQPLLKETTVSNIPEAISLASIPALNEPLGGGTFAGLITLPDGQHCAVVLLSDRPTKRLPWKKAMAWASSANGQLPSRPVAALLYANCRASITVDWYWSNEPFGDEYAWYCNFSHGDQYCNGQNTEGAAVAVRMIPLTP